MRPWRDNLFDPSRGKKERRGRVRVELEGKGGEEGARGARKYNLVGVGRGPQSSTEERDGLVITLEIKKTKIFR